MTYEEYYASILKPAFAPEPWVFGAAWSVIYPLIGIALVVALFYAAKGSVSRHTLWWFGGNVLANAAFTPLQLALPTTAWPTVAIGVVFGTLAVLVWRSWRERRVVAWLLLPYLCWVGYATVLQISVTHLNGFWRVPPLLG